MPWMTTMFSQKNIFNQRNKQLKSVEKYFIKIGC